MTKTPQEFIKSKEGSKKLLLTLIFILIIILFYIYKKTDYVIVRFNELGPLTRNMSAYYNGFRVGKIVHIGADKDFKHTLVKVNLNQKNINLPQNTTVHVERFPSGELYLKFVYPSSPAFRTIQRGDILEGVAPYSLEEFMLGQNISGVSDLVSIHVINALNATEIANKEMQIFFQTTSKTVEENRKSINAAVNNTVLMTKSLAQMAENLNQVSKKLNNAIEEENLKDTTSNIKDTTQNLAKATQDIGETMKNIDSTIAHANAAAENMNLITSGLNDTLSKRFAGIRIMFGTPVKQKECIKHARN